MKDFGQLHYFLGIEIDYSKIGIYLSQTKYALDLVKRTNMENAKPYASPVLAGKKLLPSDGDPLPDPTTYRSVVASLQYLTLTRSNPAFVVNQVCQFMHQPSTTHWIAVKHTYFTLY